MGFLGNIFGTDKAINNIVDKDTGLLVRAGTALGNLHYSDQEKANDNASTREWGIRLLDALYQARNQIEINMVAIDIYAIPEDSEYWQMVQLNHNQENSIMAKGCNIMGSRLQPGEFINKCANGCNVNNVCLLLVDNSIFFDDFRKNFKTFATSCFYQGCN